MRRVSRKRGSLIVAVLVVLFLVVLMSSQTMQTLMVVRRGDVQQSALRQARELVELGRIVSRQHPPSADSQPLNIRLGQNQTGTIDIQRMTSQVQPQAPLPPSSADTSDSASNVDQAETVYRIIAVFPAGAAGEVTATWEGSD